MKQCPTCNRQFADTDVFCPFDGGQLSPMHYDALIGATLDRRYKIERRIGEGGMGVVFLAHHIVIEKAVAIKVLKREAARDQNVVRRFVQEARAASRIGHPNIVDVTDFGSTPDGLTYSVMELVDGKTLAEVIHAEERLYPSRAVQIVLQIARALAAAHGKGIVHRDLKPENIFLLQGGGRTDFVKIVDFGIAKVTSVKKDPTLSPRLTRQGTVFGTPEYMSPEQASGRDDLDQRVDVYSLGVILFHMIVGRVPHKGDSVMETLTQVINDPVPSLREVAPELGVSEEFDRVLQRAVAKDRDSRYQSMQELAAGLEQVAGDVASQVPRAAGAPPPAAAEPAVAGPHEPTLSPERAAASETMPEPAGGAPKPGDPAFLGASPRTLRRYDLTDPDTVPETAPRSKLPALLAIVLAIGAAGVGAALLVQSSGDPAVGVPPPSDAALAVGPSDAGAAPSDAAVAVAVAPADASSGRYEARRRGRAGGGTRRGTPRGNVSIVVETRPRGGTLYMSDGAYGGADGTTLTRPGGSKVEVTCKMPGYEAGRAQLVFDGIVEIALCRMKRIKKCVPGVKNPFDDCTE